MKRPESGPRALDSMAKSKKRKRWSGTPSRPQGTQGRAGGGQSASRTRTSPAPEVVEAAGGTASSASSTTVHAKGGTGPSRGTRGPAPAGSATGPGPVAQAGPNRIARKEEARRQREMLRRKAARRRRMRIGGLIAAGLVVLAGIVVLIVANSGGGGPKALPPPSTLSGINTGPAPWPPETANLAARDQAIGLPPLGGEAFEVHFHQNLLVFVNGQRVDVPAGIGQPSPTTLAELHTHADNGTIHVEAAADRDFNLQMVFDVWGVLFTRNQIGSYRNDAQNKIRVFLNGTEYTKDFTKLPLADKQVIVVTYGTQDQLPAPIPKTFKLDGFLPGPITTPTPTPSPGASTSPSAPTPSASASPAPAPSASPS